MNPYLIEGPAVLSISGGRTSGYMLRRILDAHAGTLPSDVFAMFANTGKEMPETLDFVEEMSQTWGVPIIWVEYRGRGKHAIVTHATASRNGEPFEALITEKNYLPNPVARFCTVELKILPMERVAKESFPEFMMAVGLRADEPRRIAKLRANPSNGRAGVERFAPLADAGVTVSDVGAFWRASPFDLRLPSTNGKTMHGNCDLCYLKGADQLLSLIRENPKRAVWWMEQEARIRSDGQIKGDAGKFRSDRPSYAQMHAMATKHGELFKFDDQPLEDCMCVD